MTKIEGSYIQNAQGYNKDKVTRVDIDKAINYLPTMDGEHGAFWVGVYKADGTEYVLELHKNLMLYGDFGEDYSYKIQLQKIEESNELFDLLLNGKIEELIEKKFTLTRNLTNKETPLEKLEYKFCIVGNIVDEHYWGEEKLVRKGNKQFRPGAKVYCMPEFGGMAHESIRVLGKPRKQKSMINIIINTRLIKNFRVQKVYNPKIKSVIGKHFYYKYNNNFKSKERELNEMAKYLSTMTEEIKPEKEKKIMEINYKEVMEIYAKNHNVDESDIVPLLQEYGLNLEQADRILVFAPIALGREIIYGIEDAQLHDLFTIELNNKKVKLRYSHFKEYEELCEFAFNTRRDKIISNDEYMKVANRSCELSGVTNALTDMEKEGHKPDLQLLKGVKFGINQFWGFDNLISKDELDLIDKNNSYALSLVESLISRHKIKTNIQNHWLVAVKHNTKFKCEWLPKQKNGQLDIIIQFKDQKEIIESFAGLGETDVLAIDNAIENFIQNSFHVILDAFTDYSDSEQVLTELWNINNHEYIASIGNFGTKAAHGDHPGIPDNLFEKIETAIKNEQLESDIHAYRMFYGHINNSDSNHEFLLDNNNWNKGIELIESINWIPCDHYYSVRLFIILKKKVKEKVGLFNKIKSAFQKYP